MSSRLVLFFFLGYRSDAKESEKAIVEAKIYQAAEEIFRELKVGSVFFSGVQV